MTMEVFLLLLLITSIMTGLFTEGLKKWITEKNMTYRANALAGYVALALSVLIGAGYCILTDTAFNSKMAVCLIALMLLSWLAAMVGYDKVIQTISQIRSI